MTQAANHFATPVCEQARKSYLRIPGAAWRSGSRFCLSLLCGALLCLASTTFAQSSGDTPKPVSEMTVEELAIYVKEQELQLEAVKQARDAQKAKAAEVQEALLDRQEKLNQIVIELSELCSQRKELNPDDTEPCLPDES